MNKALKLADQFITCRPPSRVYAMCLKEQFSLFQLMMTMRNIDYEFKNARYFYNVYQTFPSWQNNLLCELYLHNFIIPQETKWNTLLYIWDVHLRALMSWIHNETNYDRQSDTYRELDRSEPLPLLAKSHRPHDLLRDWFKLTCGRPKSKIKEVFEER